MQQYADIYLLVNYSTCFGRPSRPSSGVHKTVVAASGTDHTVWGASFFKHDQISLITREYDLYQRLKLHFYVPERVQAGICLLLYKLLASLPLLVGILFVYNSLESLC